MRLGGCGLRAVLKDLKFLYEVFLTHFFYKKSVETSSVASWKVGEQKKRLEKQSKKIESSEGKDHPAARSHGRLHNQNRPAAPAERLTARTKTH